MKLLKNMVLSLTFLLSVQAIAQTDAEITRRCAAQVEEALAPKIAQIRKEIDDQKDALSTGPRKGNVTQYDYSEKMNALALTYMDRVIALTAKPEEDCFKAAVAARTPSVPVVSEDLGSNPIFPRAPASTPDSAAP